MHFHFTALLIHNRCIWLIEASVVFHEAIFFLVLVKIEYVIFFA